MTQAGGSSTINGILYQILACLDWATSLSINATVDMDELTDACLIIEPVGGGGDLRIESSSKRIVEQWKAKSNQGTWSLNQIIGEIIPDLYLAIKDNIAIKTEYYFATEGRKGTWREADNFFKSLSSRTFNIDPLNALDNSSVIKFFPSDSQACTEQTLFLLISQEVRKRQAVGAEPELETRKKLWHLLANFDIKESVVREELKSKINGYLIGVVEHREDVDAKRLELCGTILNLVSKGEVKITPGELLQMAGLNKDSFRNWPSFKNYLSRVLKNELQRKKYDAGKDVRDKPDWPNKTPILVIAGSSGQGKTWQLAKTAYEIESSGEIAVFITARGNADSDINAISDTVWKKGLNKDASITLDRVVSRLYEIVSKVHKPWLTACIDDVQSIAEARCLVDYDWEASGIRLAFTAPTTVGRAIKNQYQDKVHLLEILDFTSSELRLFLQLHNREWGTIPADVRKTLQRPLLANLFCEIVTDQNWTPANEYELYERHWLRIKNDRDQVDYPNDLALMLRLADALLEPNCIYPWPSELLEQLGINNDVRKRLENVGWLYRHENGDAIIWHDRLLNWAVAEALVRRKQLNKISIEELGSKLVEYYWPKPSHAGKSFGYVPMDVFWLASNPTRGMIDEVPKLIACIEKPEQGIRLQSLYEDMLPTLGKRIITALIIRLKEKADGDYYPILITIALISIGEKHKEEVQQIALQLLSDEHSAIQDVAMKILQKYPCKEALDRLWDLHKRNANELNNKQNTARFWQYDISSSALHSCVKCNPRWIVEKIHDADPKLDPIWELAYLLADLNEVEGPPLWSEVKAELLVKVPEKKLRSLTTCIRRFKDKTEIKRLESWLSKEADFVGPSAFSVLSELAPDVALMKLSAMSTMDLVFTRTWWLSQLHLRMPDKTDEKIIELMKEPGSDPWRIASIYDGNENEIDARVFDFLLDTLDQEIEERFDQLIISDHPWLYSRLSLLIKIYRYELIERFEARAGSGLENRLVKLVCAWENQNNVTLKRELVHARLIIRKIGGQGVTQLVNYELSHHNKQIRLFGLQWSVIQPDHTTRQLLRKISQSEVTSGDPPYPREQVLATSALAVLDEDDAVIDSIIKWAPRIPDDLTEIRSDKAPMSDESLKRLIPILDQKDEMSLTRTVIALGISGRKDYIPRVRQILLASQEGNELAGRAIEALDMLGDKDSQTVDRIGRELLVKENHHIATNALLHNGSEDSLNILEQYVLGIGAKPINEDEQLALIVWRRRPNKLIIDNLLWNVKNDYFYSSKCLEEIGKLNDPQAHELLWETIFASESSSHVVGRVISAIRGLSKADPKAALQAAQLCMKQSQKDRELIPGLLTEIDANDAIPVLINQIPNEKQTLTRWAIGRALRKLQTTYSNIIYDGITKLLSSSDHKEREAGAELCGWQSGKYMHDTLVNMAREDINSRVRSISLEALKRQNREQAVMQLMDNYKTAYASKMWTYLEAILEIGDPIILSTPGDAIWLGNILKEAPLPLINFTHNLLDKRKKEIKEAAERLDKAD